MYSISKDFAFSAAHHLAHLAASHPCRRPHGHNYVVRIELSAAHLGIDSMVMDYAHLDFVRDYIDTTLDHRDLNDVLPDLGGRTTAENIARHLYDFAARRFTGSLVVRVGVSETPKTFAWYWEETL